MDDNSVELNIEKLFKSMISSAVENYTPEVQGLPRCSHLSRFCQVSTVFKTLGILPGEDTFLSNYYCEIGTAVHRVVQKWIPNLYGQWTCPVCECIVHEGFRPTNNIYHCGTQQPLVYKEYEITWNGIQGHCDGIVLIGSEFYVLELKTSSILGLQKKVQNKAHQCQANMYVLGMQKLPLPHPLVGAIIMYISRDNPRLHKIFIQKGIMLEQVTQIVAQYKEAQDMIASGKFINIVRVCQKPGDDPICEFKSLCFRNLNNTLENYWKTYIENKRLEAS